MFNIEVGGTEAGVDFDVIRFTGDVVLGGTLAFDFIGGFVPDFDDLFEFFAVEAGNSITGAFDLITVSGLGADSQFDLVIDPATGGLVLANVQADLASVPEPSTMALLGAGLIVLAWTRRRRMAVV